MYFSLRRPGPKPTEACQCTRSMSAADASAAGVGSRRVLCASVTVSNVRARKLNPLATSFGLRGITTASCGFGVAHHAPVTSPTERLRNSSLRASLQCRLLTPRHLLMSFFGESLRLVAHDRSCDQQNSGGDAFGNHALTRRLASDVAGRSGASVQMRIWDVWLVLDTIVSWELRSATGLRGVRNLRACGSFQRGSGSCVEGSGKLG